MSNVNMDVPAKGGKLAVNIDINSVVTPFLNSVVSRGYASEESLYPFVDIYKGTQVTDVLFDIFCQYSAVDSKIWTTYADKFLQKEENGVPVDYTREYGAIYKLNKEYGVDPYSVWTKRCSEDGMRPWVSFRMNDCHCPDDKACFLRGDFFYEALKKGWMIGDHYGYYRYCFDYAVPEVREKMLSYITEQIDRYDVYGIELDFLREIYCFDYINRKDCAEIMNGFMRSVSELAKRKGKKLAVRLMRDIGQNLVFGFDAETWVKEGLVDVITVTPRWASCDSDMPIDEWKKRFPNTEIYAGIETLLLRQRSEALADADTVNGFAAAYISNGADGIYLFNYFLDPSGSSLSMKRSLDIFGRCGRAETSLVSPRRHIVTYQDIAPEGCKAWRPLPINLKNGSASVSVRTGAIPGNPKISLIVGFSEGSPDNAVISVNGTKCGEFKPCVIYGFSEVDSSQTPGGYTNDNVKTYETDISGLCRGNTQNVTFESSVDIRVEYIEIKIG